VIKLDVSDGTQTEFPVGIEPLAVAFDGTNIWVTNFGTSDATKLVAATGATVGRFAVGAYPTGIAFDGTSVWVSNSHANSVSRL
jgi:DNA-binding beta-propeller fold protein YncE